MTLFDDRERAFEAKFAHDEDRRRIGIARGNRLFGFWAAKRLGLDAEASEAYAQDVMRLGLQQADGRAVLARVVRDLCATEPSLAEDEAERAFIAMRAKAVEQLRFEDLTTPEFHPAG